MEKFPVVELQSEDVDQDVEDELMSINFLPPPTMFYGTNYAFWASEMKAGFCKDNLWELVEKGYEEPPNEEAYEALSSAQKEGLRILMKNDAGALCRIQKALDDSILMLIADIENSKEAWDFLQRDFGERGSCSNESKNEVVECVYEMVEDSISQAEPDKFENSEAHYAKPQVDEDDKYGVEDEEAANPTIPEDEAAISATENDESATQAIARQPVEAEEEAETVEHIEEEDLLKSMPMRAQYFLNNISICKCADLESYQQAIAEENENEEAHAECNFIAEFDKIIESCMEDEAFEFSDDGHCDMPRVFSNTMDDEICIEDAEDEDEPVEDILMKWGLEEIRHYYQLLVWQLATEEVDENEKKKCIWDPIIPIPQQLKMQKSELLAHDDVEGIMNLIEDEDTRQKAIEEFIDIDGRIKPKELDEKFKNKVRMKKKVKKNAEFKVWSRKKKN